MTRPRLKDYRAEKIDMVCSRCDRHGVYGRKALVKKFGASIEFVEIRRPLRSAATGAALTNAKRGFPAC